MKNRVTITLSQGLIEKIDSERGLTKRSTIIEDRLMHAFFNGKEVTKHE